MSKLFGSLVPEMSTKRKLVTRISEEEANIPYYDIPVYCSNDELIRSNRIDSEDFLDDKEVRSNNLSRVEVLDRVKQINMIPSLDMMNKEMVAEYLDVKPETLKKCINRNMSELIGNGLKMYNSRNINDIINSKRDIMSLLVKLPKGQGIEIDGIKIPNTGSYLFDRRLILNIAMLLRDSEVAKEIRRCLLDVMDTSEGKELFNDTINEKIDNLQNEIKILRNQSRDSDIKINCLINTLMDEIKKLIKEESKHTRNSFFYNKKKKGGRY